MIWLVNMILAVEHVEATSLLVLSVENLFYRETTIDVKHVDIRCMNPKLKSKILNTVHFAILQLITVNLELKMKMIDILFNQLICFLIHLLIF